MAAGDGSRRLVVGVLALAGLWVATYWLWPARPEDDAPPITFETGPVDEPGAEAAEAGAGPAVDPGSGEAAGARGARGASAGAAEGGNGREEALPDPEGPLVLPPKFERYVVQRGDDLWSIAERRYGDRRHWQAIAQANGSDLDPQRLRVGQTIRLPVDPANVQGLPVDPETGEAMRPERPSVPAAIEYTVKSGDTLSGIAQHFYGRASRWREIYEANRNALASPEALRAGMKLMIPPPRDKARAALSDDE